MLVTTSNAKLPHSPEDHDPLMHMLFTDVILLQNDNVSKDTRTREWDTGTVYLQNSWQIR
jgi:hypothetical protein